MPTKLNNLLQFERCAESKKISVVDPDNFAPDPDPIFQIPDLDPFMLVFQLYGNFFRFLVYITRNRLTLN